MEQEQAMETKENGRTTPIFRPQNELQAELAELNERLQKAEEDRQAAEHEVNKLHEGLQELAGRVRESESKELSAWRQLDHMRQLLATSQNRIRELSGGD